MPKFTCRATYTNADGSRGVENVDVEAPASNQASSKVVNDLINEGRSPQEIQTWKLPN